LQILGKRVKKTDTAVSVFYHAICLTHFTPTQ
jgi:hypothetical protein